MKIVLILFCLFLFAGNTYSQTRIGIVLQGEFDRAVIKGTQSNSHLGPRIRQRPYIGVKFGVITQFDIYNNFKLESQIGFTIRGISYTRNTNSLIQKNRGSYNLFGMEIPICLVIEFPSSSYTAKKYIGIGPVFNYNLFGIWKYNERGLPYTKQKMIFSENKWSRYTFGLTYFIGLEDSENQNIRLGVNYAVNPLAYSVTGNVYNHQLFISYSAFF